MDWKEHSFHLTSEAELLAMCRLGYSFACICGLLRKPMSYCGDTALRSPRFQLPLSPSQCSLPVLYRKEIRGFRKRSSYPRWQSRVLLVAGCSRSCGRSDPGRICPAGTPINPSLWAHPSPQCLYCVSEGLGINLQISTSGGATEGFFARQSADEKDQCRSVSDVIFEVLGLLDPCPYARSCKVLPAKRS